MSKKLHELRQELEQKVQFVADFFDKNPDDAEVTAEQKTQIADTNKRIEELEREIGEITGVTKAREEAKERKDALEAFLAGDGGKRPATTARGMIEKFLSLGDQFTKSEEFKALCAVAKANPTGRAKLGCNPVEIEGKNLVTGLSSTSAGAFVVNDRTNIVDMGTIMRELTVVDLLVRIPTDSDTVEWVEMGMTNNAAPTAEATSTSNGSKPETDITAAIKTQTVKNIPHWIPITRRALADAPMMRGIIDELLIYGIREELEDQIVGGSGSGENFTGILNYSGTTAQAYSTSIIETLRKAITACKVTAKSRPTAMLLHPNDWEDIDLSVDNEQRYYMGGPSVMGNPRLWGLPVVESLYSSLEGNGIVANWREGLLFDRESTSIYVTDSHSDFFIKNILVLLAEARFGFGLKKPSAFVVADLTA